MGKLGAVSPVCLKGSGSGWDPEGTGKGGRREGSDEGMDQDFWGVGKPLIFDFEENGNVQRI